MKFYAVRKGRTPGIYRTWDECKSQVDKFSGAEFKSFSTEDEAKAYMIADNANVKIEDNIITKSESPIDYSDDDCPF